MRNGQKKRRKNKDLQVLDTPNKVIATIPIYENEFLEKIRQRKDIELLQLTRKNRKKLSIPFKICSKTAQV